MSEIFGTPQDRLKASMSMLESAQEKLKLAGEIRTFIDASLGKTCVELDSIGSRLSAHWGRQVAQVSVPSETLLRLRKRLVVELEEIIRELVIKASNAVRPLVGPENHDAPDEVLPQAQPASGQETQPLAEGNV